MKHTFTLLTALLFAPLIALCADGHYIRLEVINGRSWLIDPAGKPFFPHGVNHIEKHGAGPGAKAVSQACRRLGFNAYGYGTPADLYHDMPYLAIWNDLVPISLHRAPSTFSFLDVFDAKVQREITQQIAATCAKNRENRNLIGYMWTDLAAWPLDGAKRFKWSAVSQTNWVQFCRALPATAAGKQAYVAFLKSEYGNDFAAFNRVYQTSVTSWEALPGANLPKETSGERQTADDAKFLRLIARQYFKVVGEATRKNDPNHLVFGDRFMFSTIVPEVMDEMLPYVDAIAIQPNFAPGFPRTQFDNVHALTKKPAIICDFAIRFKDGDKDIRGSELVEDDAVAGKHYAAYIREALATPYIIGAFWCNLIDGAQTGGKPGVKQGLFRDERLIPRPGLQSQLLELNAQINGLGKQGQSLGAGQIAFATRPVASHNDKPPFDPSKGLKDYAGKTIIGSKSSATGREDSVIAGEHAEECAELLLRNCTGLHVQVYPSFQGSWPDAAPESIEKMTFKTEGLSALVNWGRDHQQETLHHMMIGPNLYFPRWFWKNRYTAEELDQLLKRYITTLMTSNDNQRKMDAWNIFNEMFVYKPESGEYKKDGPTVQDCVWMRMGFEADQSGLKGAAKINEQHPVVFRKALKYACMASGKLEIRDCAVEEINRKSDALYQLIKHLVNSGVRVDAVGFQGHLHVNRSYNWNSVKKNIRRFKDLGLEVYITELDVSMGTWWKEGSSFPKGYEELQAERFYGIVKAAREAGVHRIDVWGLSEAVNQHWLVGQKARLFDEQFQPRPTYQAVLKALYDTQE